METIESDSDLDTPSTQKAKRTMAASVSSSSSSSSSVESSSDEVSFSESSSSSSESSDEEASGNFEDEVCVKSVEPNGKIQKTMVGIMRWNSFSARHR